jgi:hypothetical protein
MRSGITRGIVAAGAAAAAVVGLASSGWAAGPAPDTGTAAACPVVLDVPAYGISGNGKQLLMFTTNHPDVLNWVRNIVGLSGDTSLIGLDFRVQNGLLYGVGNRGGVYTIPVSGAVTSITKVSQLGVPLNGGDFGVDFNPAADRLRVVSDTGQNLRHNLNDHTTVADAHLNTPPTSGTTTGVTAAAYTNNDLSADTATTLFDLNAVSRQVVVQSPANSGQLAPAGTLGVPFGSNAGFDVHSDLSNGRAVSATAFATLTFDGTTTFYGVDLLSGAATAIGDFPLLVGDAAVSLEAG